MRVKKYTASTMPEAMEKIRRDLGEDAVILHSREINKGGFLGFFTKKSLEVTAASDPESVSSSPRLSRADQSELSVANAQTKSQEAWPGIADEFQRLQGDVTRLKASAYSGPLSVLHERLRDQEVEAVLSEQLMKPLLKAWYESNESLDTEALRQSLRRQLTEHLADKVPAPGADRKKYLLFVSPTGVGKTTTLAKIAAKAKLNEGKRIALITVDTYRIAAIEQLRAYADILDVPLEVVYSNEDFKQVKETFVDRDLVLIDSAGRNYRESSYIKELKTLLSATDTETWLVLSLASKDRDMQAIYRQFASLPVKRCVLTKVDETRTYGSAVNFWLTGGIVPVYFTNGQNVPDDLIPADPQWLANKLVGDESIE